MTKVVPVIHLAGESAEDTARLRLLFDEAARFIKSYRWCGDVLESFFGFGVGGVVDVFLFRIRPSEPGVDEWLWVVVGDVPPAYLVTDGARNPACALKVYTELMVEWVEAVHAGRPTEDLVSVNVAPTEDWALELSGRLDFLRRVILRRYEADLDTCERPE